MDCIGCCSGLEVNRGGVEGEVDIDVGEWMPKARTRSKLNVGVVGVDEDMLLERDDSLLVDINVVPGIAKRGSWLISFISLRQSSSLNRQSAPQRGMKEMIF